MIPTIGQNSIHCIDINLFNDDKILLNAIKNDCSYREIESLVERGANIHVVDRSGKAPLHLAIEHRDSYRLLQLFIESGAILSDADEYGNTPLHVAVGCDAPYEVIKLIVEELLLKSRETICAADKMRRTPLHAAIIKYQSDLSRPNLWLYSSCQRGRQRAPTNREALDKIIKRLMKATLDVYLKDENEKAAVDVRLACKYFSSNSEITNKIISAIFLKDPSPSNPDYLALQKKGLAISDFWEKCAKERDALSKIKWGRGRYRELSLKDILEEKGEKRLTLAKNMIDKHLASGLEEKYPIFGPIIRVKLEEGRVKRNNLTFLAEKLEGGSLPNEIMWRILQFLPSLSLAILAAEVPF